MLFEMHDEWVAFPAATSPRAAWTGSTPPSAARAPRAPQHHRRLIAYTTRRGTTREYALTRTERTSRLAKRPYDLRHAGISFWLYSGVDPAECARRARQSIEVLFRHYAKFLDGLREQVNRLIEQSMNEWQRVSQGDVPEG